MLSHDDRQKLLQTLIPHHILNNERGRESVLIASSLSYLRPQIDISGPSAVAVPLLVNYLESYGRVTHNHHALGRFLNTLKGVSGIEQATFLTSLINKYDLMIPVADIPLDFKWESPDSPDQVLEKIIGENTLRPISFLESGLQMSRSVAYIEVVDEEESWSGTGFLIGSNLLITNNHVIPSKEILAKTIFRFNYELDTNGNVKIHRDYRAVQNGIFLTNRTLDYSLIELANSPGENWGYVKLSKKVPLIDSRVNIIQHPNGLPKQISFQNNFVKFVNNNILQYVTSTQPGASGSPVFDDNWHVVGLHHSGGWLPQGENGPLYYVNEGILIASILQDLPNSISAEILTF